MGPIIGIGEVLWDIYPDGRKVAGGAPFNFAFHCHQLGHRAAILSRVGDDDLGRELRDEVRRAGMSDEYLQTDPTRPTGTVQVTFDAAGEPTYKITEQVAWDAIEASDQLGRLSPGPAAVCFGTLAQRTETGRAGVMGLIPQVRSGIRVFDVNLRGEPDAGIIRASLDHADWVKVSHDELQKITTLLQKQPQELMLSPDKRNPGVLPAWLVTRGKHGCEVLTPDESFHQPSAPVPCPPPGEVPSTVGAGDSFTAAMVCLILEKRSFRDAARFAVHYAARVCGFKGATPKIDRAEVERAAFGPV
jgi:fructokinase